jgi:hypothetical protein
LETGVSHVIVGKIDQGRGDLLFSPASGHCPCCHVLKSYLHCILATKAPIGIIDRISGADTKVEEL